MCGLLGVYGNQFGSPEFDIFEKLLFLNVFRGSDSTGIMKIEKNKSIKTRKSLLASPQFLSSEASDIIRDKGPIGERPIGLIGHTRAATKGSVTLKNAHPFGFDNVVGMHNGTIHTHFKHRNEYETDSEALYRNINDYGVEEALNNANAYDSAWALQFIDKKERTLNFVRNSQRSLYFTYIFGQTTLVWSSEKEAIQYILRLKKMSTNKGWKGDEKVQYFTLNPNEMMTVKIGESPSEAVITKLNVEEKKTGGTNITTRTGSYGGTNNSTFTQGEWKQIGSGYEWVPHNKKEVSSTTNSTKDNIIRIGPSFPKLTGANGTNALKAEKIKKSTAGDPVFANHKDAHGMDALKKLSWLRPAEIKPDDAKKGLPELDWVDNAALLKMQQEEDDVPFEGPYKNGDGHTVFKGFMGMKISQSEYHQRLKEGCFACSESLNLDDPHDYEKINNVHWWTREYWACDYCYKHSDGDWVRCTIEDDWDDADNENKGISK